LIRCVHLFICLLCVNDLKTHLVRVCVYVCVCAGAAGRARTLALASEPGPHLTELLHACTMPAAAEAAGSVPAGIHESTSSTGTVVHRTAGPPAIDGGAARGSVPHGGNGWRLALLNTSVPARDILAQLHDCEPDVLVVDARFKAIGRAAGAIKTVRAVVFVAEDGVKNPSSSAPQVPQGYLPYEALMTTAAAGGTDAGAATAPRLAPPQSRVGAGQKARAAVLFYIPKTDDRAATRRVGVTETQIASGKLAAEILEACAGKRE
jgi:hypothetical protein